jgi:hypothetical protein
MQFYNAKTEIDYNHLWFDNIPEMEQINEATGRTYRTPDGNIYQSVTSFLGRFSDGSIEAWKKAVGSEEANRVSKRATTRGSLLHENVENYLLNNEVSIPKVNFLAVNLFKRFVPVLNQISNIRLLEDRLYSDTLKLAGTVDCVAEWNGKLSIIDFKTSGVQKTIDDIESYWIQTAIYSLMVEELFKVKIDQLVILMAIEAEDPLVFIDSRRNWLKKLAYMIKERNADAAV